MEAGGMEYNAVKYLNCSWIFGITLSLFAIQKVK